MNVFCQSGNNGKFMTYFGVAGGYPATLLMVGWYLDPGVSRSISCMHQCTRDYYGNIRSIFVALVVSLVVIFVFHSMIAMGHWPLGLMETDLMIYAW